MKTMLDKIGIIGDVKTAFNRLEIEPTEGKDGMAKVVVTLTGL